MGNIGSLLSLAGKAPQPLAALNAGVAESAVAGRTHAVLLTPGSSQGSPSSDPWRGGAALPFAGALRIIDFPLSNCINSGIRRITVLAPSEGSERNGGLAAHLERRWGRPEAAADELIDVVPAVRHEGDARPRGTAEALFHNLAVLRRAELGHVLVLTGEHLYTMDYSVMLAEHVASGADATVAGAEVSAEQAGAFGVIETDARGRVTAFHAQPPEAPHRTGPAARALANMGVWVFRANVLYQALARDAADPASNHDLAENLLPRVLAQGRVQAHRFERSCAQRVGSMPYWHAAGTLDAYWLAHMDLLEVRPQLNLHDDAWPLRSERRALAPARFVLDGAGRRGMAIDSEVCGGCIVSGATVRRSWLSFNVSVEQGSLLEACVVLPGVHIGRSVVLRHCVVEQGCRLPEGFVAGVDPAHDAARFHVTERGVTLITLQSLGQLPQPRCCGDAVALQ